MAEYEDNLEAVQQQPVPEFYVFATGSSVERYTSYSRGLTFLGSYFAAASITRGGIKQDTKFGAISLNLTTPITPAIAAYIPNQPIQPVQVTIYRSHIDYLDQYSIFFKGKIKYVQLRGKLASAQCESKNKYMVTKVPMIIYQAFCNHDVYDDHGTWGCRLDEFEWRRTAVVSNLSADGQEVTLSYTDGLGNPAVDYFKGGNITYNGDQRFITSHDSATVIGLHIPFDSTFVAGASVIVNPGCDGNPATCKNRFDNLNNFLGMPYIPSTNPVVWGFK